MLPGGGMPPGIGIPAVGIPVIPVGPILSDQRNGRSKNKGKPSMLAREVSFGTLELPPAQVVSHHQELFHV